MKAHCTVNINDKLIVFQEQRSKLTIKNPKQANAKKIIIDGCQITEGVRCDFLLLAKDMEFFIELKGSDINHAIKQLETSICKLSADAMKHKKISFVISARCPMASATISNLRAKFRKRYNSELLIKNSPFIHNL